MLNKFILKCENCYDIYIFNKSYKYEDIENFISKHKIENFGNWNLETIEKDIRNNFEVKEIISCDILLDLDFIKGV